MTTAARPDPSYGAFTARVRVSSHVKVFGPQNTVLNYFTNKQPVEKFDKSTFTPPSIDIFGATWLWKVLFVIFSLFVWADTAKAQPCPIDAPITVYRAIGKPSYGKQYFATPVGAVKDYISWLEQNSYLSEIFFGSGYTISVSDVALHPVPGSQYHYVVVYQTWPEDYVQVLDYRFPAVESCQASQSPPPPPPPPLGCASGAGGFFVCPGNSPPTGKTDSSTQNNGTPDPTDPTSVDPTRPGNADDSAGGSGGGGGVGGDTTTSVSSNSCKRADAVGDPILASTGNVYTSERDYASPIGLNFVRSYNSSLPGWVHNFQLRIIANSTQADVVRPDGKIFTFLGSGAGAWATNGTVSEQLTKITPVNANDPSWKFTTAQGTVELYDANGMPKSITWRGGRGMTFTANGQLLLTATDNYGRSIKFAYDGQSRLTAVTTPDALQMNYSYDSQGRLAQVTYPDKFTRKYVYENAAVPLLLTGIIDENGNRFASWTYDSQGRAISGSQAGGANSVQLSYGANSATQVTDAMGAQRTLQFTSVSGRSVFAGQNQPCAQCYGDAASKTVDPVSGMVTQSTDYLGINQLFTINSIRKLVLTNTQAANRPEAQTTRIDWHPLYRLPVLVSQAGRTTAYTYDALGNKLTETVTDTSAGLTAGQSRTWAWTYNPQGLVATSTDPRGNTSQYTYDAAGNLASVKNPLNQQTNYTYDGAGRVLTQTDPNGLLTSFSYDPRGRVLQTTRGGEASTYTYTPGGQVRSATLPNGYAVAYTYDAAQRLTGATDNRNNRISYTLDAMGNRVREEVKDPGGTIAQLTTRTINTLNRVASMAGAANQTTQYGYDANGEPTSSTDPLNQTTRQTLDPLRRPVATTFADNAAATQAWNPLDQLTQLTDPKGVATQYTRNAFGEVVQETSPDIGSISYTRDANGNITASTDAKGQTTQIARDALDRPSSITLAASQAAQTTQQFTYDTAGNLSQVTDNSGSTSYSRDALSRILQKTQTIADSATAPSAYSVQYQYHAGGQVAQITYPSGLKVFYRKNTSGQINQVDVQEPGGTAAKPKPLIPFVANLTYTALNQPRAWSWNCMAGVTTGAAPIPCGTASRSFDADGRMTANEFATYGYDSASRITSITQNLWASLVTTDPVTGIATSSSFTTPITWSAGYDSRNRLTSFNRTGNSTTTSYTYDPNSNRLSSINKTTGDTDQDGDFDAVDFQKTISQALALAATSNKLTGFTQTLTTQRTNAAGNPVTSTVNSQVNYSLDQNGNLTSDGLRTFEYDAANRLSKVQVSQTAEASKITYLHNALGQRVFKSEPQVAQTAPSQTELGIDFVTWLKSNFGWLFAQAQANATLGQSYVYDDANLGSTANLLGEYGNGGTKSAGRIEYIWLPTEDRQSIPIAIYKGGRFLAVHSDHLGTPRLIVDDTSKPVWQWPYSAFGDNKPTGILKATPNPKAAITNVPQLLKATAATEINLRFPGQYFDEESNLNYNYFRSYQASQGRYTQGDPIGLSGGFNRFGYVEGNPLLFIDPDGLQAEHTKNARPSTEQKHQEAEARRARDAGGEKADKGRAPPRKRPPGTTGPWPRLLIPGLIPLFCPLCEIMMPEPSPPSCPS